MSLPTTTPLACVTVTYNPDISILAAQLRGLPATAHKIIIDNASAAESRIELEKLCAEMPQLQAHYNEKNLGLAAALNQGARIAAMLMPSDGYILLLDQDSEPQPGSVEALITGYESLRSSGENVGAVGPTLKDTETGLTHGFHQQTPWRWRRVHPAITAQNPVPCTNLNGSGTLMPLGIYLAQGGLDEALFIDHVDTEWSFRLIAAGYTLWGVPQAVFLHRMGESSRRIWLFGWRMWPVRSSRRHYFLYRNAAILMRRNYVGRVWKLWAVVKLVITMCVTLIIGPMRLEQIRCMWEGLREAPSKSKGSGS